MTLYAITIFLGAFLLFQIQPLVAKLTLPWFGGAASVWVTSVLFFQLLLLGGYIFAHWLVQRLSPKHQTLGQTALLGASLLVLPITLPAGMKPDGTEAPFLHLFTILFATVGMPYFLLSTASPLLQAWYARTHTHALPYRLFALSNLASLLGLTAYPFLIEPILPLHVQRIVWSGAYTIFVALFIAVAYRRRVHKDEAALLKDDTDFPAPNRTERFRWLLLAACPSMLLLSITNHLTQNVASVPFLWILPLSLYLLTFILAFDLERFYNKKYFTWLAIIALIILSLDLIKGIRTNTIWKDIALFSSGLFVCSLACHGELARRKPHPRHLTSFYIYLSVGGALGGVLIGFAAPLLLPGTFELALSLVFCAGLVLFVFSRDLGRIMVSASLLATVVVVSGAALFIHQYIRSADVMERNFYGSLRVYKENTGTPSEVRSFVHGVITHGKQFVSQELRREPLTYFSTSSGIGIVLHQMHRLSERIGVIGLGIGTLATYTQPGDVIKFYEIDPSVVRLARSHFTFLTDCLGTVEVVLGDGRLSLEREPDQRFDVLVIDAFSGDAIPAHLLTREAVQLYFRHLSPDGILAFHITNRYVDLAPVITALGRDLGYPVLFYTSLPVANWHVVDATWALISRDRITLPALTNAAWTPDNRTDVPVWTDDFNNLIRVIK